MPEWLDAIYRNKDGKYMNVWTVVTILAFIIVAMAVWKQFAK